MTSTSSSFFYFRPFVEFFSAPFWSVVSTRFRQAKNILLMALLSWIVFTVAIGLIKPPPHSCWRETNATHQSIERVGYTTSTMNTNLKHQIKRQVITLPTPTLIKNLNNKTKVLIEQGKDLLLNKTNPLLKTVVNSSLNRILNTTSSSTTRKRRTTTTTIKTTIKTTLSSNDDEEEDDDVESDEEDEVVNEKSRITSKTNKNNVLHINTPQKVIGNPIEITLTNISLVKPLASPVLYDQKDVRNVFMVFLLLIIIGEFFSAPAITLAVKKHDLSFFSCIIKRIFCYLGCLYINIFRSRY